VNEKFKELAERARIQMCSQERLQEFAELIFNECVKAVEATPRHCAFTTRDLDLVNGTIDLSVDSLYNHFNIDKTYKAPK
jgi:hypothetical protein